MRKIVFAAALLFTFVVSPVPAAEAGPLILPSGTDVILTVAGDDTTFGPLALGFTFNYFGVDYTTAFVNSNGNLSFVAGSTTFINPALPTAAPPRVSAFWDDLFLPPGDIRYNNSTPGVFAAMWNGIGCFGASCNNTAEVVLFGAGNPFGFAAGSIALSYGNINNTNDGSVTVGLNAGDNANFATLFPLGIGGANGILNTTQAIALSNNTYLFTPSGDTFAVTVVAEPTSLTLMGLGALAVARRVRRRHAR